MASISSWLKTSWLLSSNSEDMNTFAACFWWHTHSNIKAMYHSMAIETCNWQAELATSCNNCVILCNFLSYWNNWIILRNIVNMDVILYNASVTDTILPIWLLLLLWHNITFDKSILHKQNYNITQYYLMLPNNVKSMKINFQWLLSPDWRLVPATFSMFQSGRWQKYI